MPSPVESRSGQRPVYRGREVTPFLPWFAGLLAGLACVCLLAAFANGLTLAAAQEGRPARTGTPPGLVVTATGSPTPTETVLATATPTETLVATATPPGPASTLLPEPSPTPTATNTPRVEPADGHLLQEPVPTPTAPPPEPTAVPVDGDPHVSYLATTASCAACHRAHTSQGWSLRGAWPEEVLCFDCHTDAGPGTDVASAFTYPNSTTAIFQHDVAATSGVHRVGETEGTAYGGENRHVECEDCHQPHEATRGPADAPMLQREMNAVSGVDPVWTGHGAPAAYVWLPQAEREHQVCFKCHSSFTTLPDYLPDGWDGSQYVADGLRKLTSGDPLQVPDLRDMAAEFNPYEASFHPVVTQGRNPNIPLGAFVGDWTPESLVYCTDCHSNPAASAGGSGPHGSPLLHLLNGSTEYQTADPDAPAIDGTELCFQCHDADDYLSNGGDSNFRRGNRNLHGQHTDDGACYQCHDSHGSEQLHLLNLDLSITADSDTYLLPGYDGLPTNSQTFWQISPDGSEKTCWIVCHGHDHAGSTYPNLGD